MLSYIHLSDLPERDSFVEAEIVVGSWFGMGLIEPLRAGLAVASVLPLAVILTARSFVALFALAQSMVIAGAWVLMMPGKHFISIQDDRRIVVDEVAGYLAGMAVIGRAGWLGRVRRTVSCAGSPEAIPVRQHRRHSGRHWRHAR